MDDDAISTSSSDVHLPENAIHTILSSLSPVDAIRASATSRQWRSAWTSSPILAFDEKPCPFKNSDFFDYIDRSISRWRERGDNRVCLDKLSLSAAIRDDQLAAWLNEVVAFAASRSVSAIELVNQASEFWTVLSESPLWSSLFACKSLEELSLTCFQLFSMNPLPVKFDSAKKLALSCIMIDDIRLMNLISSFPLLEDLKIGFCGGLYQMLISSPSLRSFQLSLTENLAETVQIEAPNLRSFSYMRVFRAPGIISFVNCKSLTSLILDRSVFDSESENNTIQDYISQILLLKDLTLSSCRMAETVLIAHPCLKRLNFKRSFGFKKAVIDTLNLCYFQYCGSVFHFQVFRYRFGFLEAHLELYTGSFDETQWFWFVKLRNFLEYFNKYYSLKLDCHVEGFPEEFRDNDFLPDPFDGITHLTFINPMLALDDCLHFVSAMVDLFPCAKTLSLKTSFAIVSIEYDESRSFSMEWVPTVGASNTEKYGMDYRFIKDVMDELLEFLSWSSEEMDESENDGEDESSEKDEDMVEDEKMEEEDEDCPNCEEGRSDYAA